MPTLPRVTAILDRFGLGPDLSAITPKVLERARERGSLVHEAIEDDRYGLVVDVDLRSDVLDYLTGVRRFVKETGYRSIVSEVELMHPIWHYAGRGDDVGWIGTGRVLVDWKTAADPDLFAAAIQTTAYRHAWEAMHPTEPISRRLVVRITPGAYRVYDLEVPDARYPSAAEAWQMFTAGVVLLRAQERRENMR